MLAAFVLLDLQRRVVASFPVDNEVEDPIADPNNNLPDHQTQDPFACCRRGAVAVPRLLEIGAELHQSVAIRCGQRRIPGWRKCLEFALKRQNGLQSPVPSLLQLTNHQPVLGIDGVILPAGPRRFLARLRQSERDLLTLLV